MSSRNRLVCGRRLVLAAVGLCIPLLLLGTGVSAQRVIVEPVRPPPPVSLPPPVVLPGTGTLPGLGGSLPPPLPRPILVPQPAAPVAAPAARVVRFRCELAPNDQACRDPGPSDGGGGDDECNCARDYCHWNDQGRHVCEKLQ